MRLIHKMRLIHNRHIKTNTNINASCVTNGTKELLSATSPSCYLPAAPDWVLPLGWRKSHSSWHLGLEGTVVRAPRLISRGMSPV